MTEKYDNLEFPVCQWQWQSDSDPWKEVDPSRWTWQSYSEFDNNCIEEAFLLNHQFADLKEYEIDLKKMIQINKQYRHRIRRVRRQEPSRFSMRLSGPNTITKDQKIMNETFGTIQDFLEYILKRTPDAYFAYQTLKGLSLDCNRTEFEDLIHQVVTCIQRGAELRAKIIKTRTDIKVRDFISEAREITNMIEENSFTLGDFLKAILKTYTMETFICYWLNELLRNENWEEINMLTPFLVCLLTTFQLSDYAPRSQNSPNTLYQQFLGLFVKQKLYLYRGTAFTKEQLSYYDPKRIKYFSWNSVTSTTRDRKIARDFMNSSVDSISNFRVVFVIEIDFHSSEEIHELIDVSKYSRYPREQEVILAPGSVFKLREISLIENDAYEIRLKAIKRRKKAQEKMPWLDILQDEPFVGSKAIIDGLPSQNSFKLLEMLTGNKLVRKLEIRNSKLEEHIMQEIENLRLTMNVRRESITLANNTICVSSLSMLIHYFSGENLSKILESNKVRFGSEITKNLQIDQKLAIPKLTLEDKTLEMFYKNGQLKDFWESLKNEVQTTKISFSVKKTEIKSDEIEGFFEFLEESKSLEDLTLILNEHLIKNFKRLCQVISSLTNLSRLSLQLPFSDKELNVVQNMLRSLQCLQSLSLKIESNSQSSLDWIKHIEKECKGLKSLKSIFITCV